MRYWLILHVNPPDLALKWDYRATDVPNYSHGGSGSLKGTLALKPEQKVKAQKQISGKSP